MIELLESRIAPAAIVHFTEIDGDKITVKTTAGNTGQLETALGILNGANSVNGFTVNLNGSASLRTAFAKTDLKITATKHGNGDGRANFVGINAYDGGVGLDMGKVKVDGDLVFIDVGDTDFNTPALKSLTVTNMVRNQSNLVTFSNFEGNVGSINVQKDMNSLILSAATHTGPNGTVINSFHVGGTMGSAAGQSSGYMQVARIGKLTIDGTLMGSNGVTANHGAIHAISLGKIKVHAMALGGEITLDTP